MWSRSLTTKRLHEFTRSSRADRTDSTDQQQPETSCARRPEDVELSDSLRAAIATDHLTAAGESLFHSDTYAHPYYFIAGATRMTGTTEACKILHQQGTPYEEWPPRLRAVCEEGCELSLNYFKLF